MAVLVKILLNRTCAARSSVQDVGQLMKHFFSFNCILFLAVVITACMPLQQQEPVAYTHPDFYARYDEGYLTIAFEGELAQKEYVILDEETYVTGPDDERYSTFHKETDRGTQLFITNSRGKTVNSWPNGIWKLALSAKGKSGHVDVFAPEFKLWTFYYSPFVHGAPN